MYHSVLEASGGVVPEFVNPKYTDATRCMFKSPTRLECKMQDIPKFFPATAAVGFTCFERESYCPVKNATADGVKKQASGQNPSCAAAGQDAWLSTGFRF
ncbi:UDP-sugar pyrophosphorylase [Diplonema papillatum]|nr:UDP-sugar pyrophosphorylase [Diplonema papillatum]